MELRVLRYFLMVAREENITRAAGLLHVTQPTLSRQLIQLEEELGVKLFHRNKYRITLTEEGLLLKQRAQEIVALSDKAKQELTKSEGTLSGEIAIGCAEARSFSVLAGQIVAFRKLYPRVRFRIYSATADDVKDRMENGLLDMGLLMEPVDIGRYAFIRMPVRERYGVLVRRDSPLAEKESVRPEDLVGMPRRGAGRDRRLVRGAVRPHGGRRAVQPDSQRRGSGRARRRRRADDRSGQHRGEPAVYPAFPGAGARLRAGVEEPAHLPTRGARLHRPPEAYDLGIRQHRTQVLDILSETAYNEGAPCGRLYFFVSRPRLQSLCRMRAGGRSWKKGEG